LPLAPSVGTGATSRVAVPAIGSSTDEDTAALLTWPAIYGLEGKAPGGPVTRRASWRARAAVSPLGHEQLATDQTPQLDALVAAWLHDTGHRRGRWQTRSRLAGHSVDVATATRGHRWGRWGHDGEAMKLATRRLRPVSSPGPPATASTYRGRSPLTASHEAAASRAQRPAAISNRTSSATSVPKASGPVVPSAQKLGFGEIAGTAVCHHEFSRDVLTEVGVAKSPPVRT
jgi:hypothetical protein